LYQENKIYDLSIDLINKISIYDNKYKPEKPNLPEHYIVLITHALLKADVHPYLLNRETVEKLLQNKIKWPCSNSERVKFSSTVTIDHLEANHLIRFINNTLNVPFNFQGLDKYSDEIKDQLEAVNILYNIQRGWEGCDKLRLIIEHNNLETIHKSIKAEYADLKDIAELEFIVQEDNGKYSLECGYEYIRPIGTLLWEVLLAKYNNSYEAFCKWFELMTDLFDYHNIAQLEFNNHSNKIEFLNAATEFVLNEDDLKRSWDDEARLTLVENNGKNGVFDTSNDYFNRHIQPLLNKTLTNYFDAYKFWTDITSKQAAYPNIGGTRATLSELIHFVIKKESLLFKKVDSYPNTNKLMEACLDIPWLSLEVLFMHTNYEHLISMLRHKETTSIALSRLSKYDNLFPNNIESDRNEYKKEWTLMIWKQAVDIYFSQASNLLRSNDLKSISRILADFLLITSKELFSNYSERIYFKTKIDHFIEALEKVTYSQSNNSPERSLLKDLFPSLTETILNRIEHSNVFFPYGSYFLLFWCLDNALKYSNSIDNKINTYEESIQNISEKILSIYNDYINSKLEGEGSSFDESPDFDKYNWGILFSKLNNKNKMINALTIDKVKEKFTKEHSSTNYNVISAIRTHVRLLLNIYESYSDKNNNFATRIADKIIVITKHFGFHRDEYRGIFTSSNDGSDRIYREELWQRLVRTSDYFDDKTYDKFIKSFTKSKITIVPILKIYSSTSSENRRRSILKLLNKVNINNEKFISYTELEQAYVLAANNHLDDIVDFIINYPITYPIPEHDVILNKAKLHKIYNDSSIDIAKKEQQINEIFLSFDTHNNNNNFKNSDLINNFNRYKRFLSSLLYFDNEPIKTYNYLKQLFSEEPNQIFASNMLAANIRMIEQAENLDKNIAYKNAIDEWSESKKKFKHYSRSMHETNLLLYCYKETNNNESFNILWGTLSVAEQFSFDLYQLRCSFLQKQGLASEALEYIKALHVFHKKIPKAIKKEIKKLEKQLLKDIKLKVSSLKTSEILQVRKLTVDDARKAWNEILRFDAIKQACVFCNNLEHVEHLDNFVIEIIKPVIDELINRKGNLYRKNNDNNDLQIEDLINDWFVSLVNQNIKYLKWQMNDQKRSGFSESKRGPGEADGWTMDSNNEYLFLMEAFKLTTFKSKSIKDHLNKLTKYDQIGKSPLLVLVYTFSPDFNNLSDKYKDFVTKENYEGFDNVLPQKDDSLSLLDNCNLPGYKIYKESRLRAGKTVNVIHALIDFYNTEDN